MTYLMDLGWWLAETLQLTSLGDFLCIPSVDMDIAEMGKLSTGYQVDMVIQVKSHKSGVGLVH